MRTNWNLIKYFSKDEFYSPDCSCDKINQNLVLALDYVRKQMGRPIVVNSGYRTVAHNEAVGGVSNSQHTLGNAADIHISSQHEGDQIEYWFKDYIGEECGVGRYNTFIHLDVRGTKARWDNRV